MRERDDLPFPMEEYRTRLSNVRQSMDQRGYDLLMCFTPENMYYLTGYSTIGYYTYQCLLVPLNGEPMTITRHLETDNVRYRTWVECMADYRDEEDPIDITRSALVKMGLAEATIGLEMNCWWLTVESFLELQKALPKARFKNCTGLVEHCMVIKSQAEIEYIRQAARAAGAGMRAALEATHEGTIDSEVAAAAYAGRIRAGSEYVGANVFCPSGPKSGLAHATWEGRRIEKGDVVFYEIGGCVKRYHGASMRTAVIGEPSQQVRRAAEASMAGLGAALDALRPGVTGGDADAAARNAIAAAGFGEYHHHRLGYHIGIGYPPNWAVRGTFSLNRGVKDELRPGMVFHLVPAILIPGVGGFGNSETVLITQTGHEVLTDMELRLFIR